MLYILDMENRTIITRFGASAVQYNPRTALASWRRGVSGYFPDWFERRRRLSFNFCGFLIWAFTLGAILHYIFGFSFSSILRRFQKFIWK